MTENNALVKKSKYVVLAVLLILIGSLSFLFLTGNNANESKVDFTLNLVVVDSEGETFFEGEQNFNNRLTMTLSELFDEFDFDYSGFQENNFERGHSWRLLDTDELLSNSLNKIMVEDLTTDKTVTVVLVRSANRHFVNIDLQRGSFSDPNNFVLSMPQVHYVGVSNGILRLEVEYGTNLNDVFYTIFVNELLTGVGIYFEVNFLYFGNPLPATDWFPYMPDHEVDLLVEWFSDLSYGTNVLGTAFTDGTLPEDLVIRLYADMDEDEMTAAVNAAINAFGTETGRTNIRAANFAVDVTRFVGENAEGQETVIVRVVIDRVNIGDLTVNGTAYNMLVDAGFNLVGTDFFLDMTEYQIEEVIAARMIATNRTNFVFGNFVVTIINENTHNLHISIAREAFDNYTLLGNAIANDLLTAAILRLETTFFRDMTELEIIAELQRVMNEANDEFERIYSTHFEIFNVSGMHSRILSLDIRRIEMENIDTQGSAFFDEDYNVRVLETLNLSNLYLDMTAQMLIDALQGRIDAMNNEYQLFDFNRNHFTTPAIQNVHSTNIIITIGRVEIDPTINGDGSNLFNEATLKQGMDTIFRDLLEEDVVDILNRGIDAYNVSNFTSNVFSIDYLKSDYSTIVLTINRRGVTTSLFGSAVTTDGLLNANNLSVASGIYMDMTDGQIRSLLNERINNINTDRFHEDNFNILSVIGVHTESIDITILRVEAIITGAGAAFTTANLLDVVTLGLHQLIFRDMTLQMIIDAVNDAMDASSNERIDSAFFTIGNITAPHNANITINVTRNLINPFVNGTAIADNIFEGQLALENIYRDMTEALIRTSVEGSINEIFGTRFNHLNFDQVIVEGAHTANITIRINRTHIVPAFTGNAHVADVLSGVINLNEGIFRDMEEPEIRTILNNRLDALNNPRFRAENFDVTAIAGVHTDSLLITITRIDVTPTSFEVLGHQDALPDASEFFPQIFKDMDNETIVRILGDAIHNLGGDHSHYTRGMFIIIVNGLHTDELSITFILVEAGVNITGSAVEQGIIPRDLLDHFEFYLTDEEDYIHGILAQYLYELGANLVIGNFDVKITGYFTDYITITINRRAVANITIEGSAADARSAIANLNVTQVYWDMVSVGDGSVASRVSQAITILGQDRLTFDAFLFSVTGLHSDNMTITLNRIEMPSLILQGTAMTDARFVQADLTLETIFRDHTMAEILAIVNNAIDYSFLSDDRFASEHFEVTGFSHTAIMAVIDIDRRSVTPSLDGNAVSLDLLTVANLNVTQGFFMDMSANEILSEIAGRLALIPGARFERDHFYVSEETITGTHSMNIVIEISRVLANINVLGDAFTTEDLLTVENLGLDTDIFRDMTLPLIQGHLTTAINSLSATSPRIHVNHFAVGIITGVHSETVTITITRELATIEMDGSAFADGLLTDGNLLLTTSIFRDMTQDMILDYISDIIDAINATGNARIHNDHFTTPTITSAHAANIIVYINRVAANITGAGDAFTTAGLLSEGLLNLGTQIFRDMTEDMIEYHLVSTMDTLNNAHARIHSSHFTVESITTAHSASIEIYIRRNSVTPSTSGSAFDYNVLSGIDLSGIYLDMEDAAIVSLVQDAIDALGNATNRIERVNFTQPVVTGLHSVGLNVQINRIAIDIAIAGTAITLYNRFTQVDLNIASLEVTFYRDMLAEDIIDVINDAIDNNLPQVHFTSEAFNVVEFGRDINTIIIHINRIEMDASISGSAIVDGRFTEANIITPLRNVYRDMTSNEFEEAVNEAINTLEGINDRFVASNFDVDYISRDFDTDSVVVNIDRIEMTINLSGSAFPRLSGDEFAADANETGIANLMLGMVDIFMDMTYREVVYVIWDALDFVGDLLDRPTFNRNTFDVFYYGRDEEVRSITFTVERIGVTPDFGGDAIFPGGPFLPEWLQRRSAN